MAVGPSTVSRQLEPPQDAPHDRIDQIWVAGAATTVRSQIVGDEGGRDVDIEIDPWGSDHRAVVSTVDLTPGPSPVMVARRAAAGEPGPATSRRPTTRPAVPARSVVIVPRAVIPATDADRPEPHAGRHDVDGSVTFATGAWQPAAYDAVLVDATDAELSRTGFFLSSSRAPCPWSTPHGGVTRGRTDHRRLGRAHPGTGSIGSASIGAAPILRWCLPRLSLHTLRRRRAR